MRRLVFSLILVTLSISVSNTQQTLRAFDPEQKLFIITLDGFRWQEVFSGADSALLSETDMNADTSISRAMYWDESPDERRQKLLPFFWNVIATHGELYGNRKYGNKVNVSNPYALSYPGYNELLTGSVDYTIYSNDRKTNSNKNILQLLSHSESYEGKVAAFTSWDMFPYILDRKEKADFVLNAGLEPVKDPNPTPAQEVLNVLQGSIGEHSATRYDELTFIACKEYIKKQKPSVVFLSFSGTDNAGHAGKYDQYLQQANNADRMIGELWRMLQLLPEYAGKTSFLITTDHGRGKNKLWKEHGMLVPGSSQTWFALLGPSVIPHGEMKYNSQTYQKELNSLVLDLLSPKF